MTTRMGTLSLLAGASLLWTTVGNDPSRSTFWVDYDADGRADLCTFTGGKVELRANLGAGGFLDVTTELPDLEGCQAITWQDFDEAVGAELIAAGSEWVRIVRWTGESFTVQELARSDGAPTAIEVGVEDLDGDRARDLWVRTRGGYELLMSSTDYFAESVELTRMPWLGTEAGVPVREDVAEQATSPLTDDSATARTPGGRALVATRSPGRAPAELGASSSSASASSAPTAQSLQPGCAQSIADQAGGPCLEASSTPQLGTLYPLSTDFNVSPAGRVGIGSLPVDHSLEIVDTSPISTISELLKLQSWSLHSNADARLRFVLRDGSGQDQQGELIALKEGNDGVGYLLRTSNGGSKVDAMRIAKNGRVGIGGTPSDSTLEVIDGDDRGTISRLLSLESRSTSSDGDARLAWVLRNGNGIDRVAEFVAVKDGNDGVGFLFRTNDDGNVVDAMELRKDGRVKVKVLEITGGADLAEPFRSAVGELDPGTVVVLNEALEGAVHPCTETYDRKVVGVVSGAGGVNPGLVLGQEDLVDGDVRIAMVGQVEVRCSAENGPIRPGDLLTTSSVAGHAMRASDSDRAFGAVIGKALGSLDEGQGLVRVVVNLQ